MGDLKKPMALAGNVGYLFIPAEGIAASIEAMKPLEESFVEARGVCIFVDNQRKWEDAVLETIAAELGALGQEYRDLGIPRTPIPCTLQGCYFENPNHSRQCDDERVKGCLRRVQEHINTAIIMFEQDDGGLAYLSKVGNRVVYHQDSRIVYVCTESKSYMENVATIVGKYMKPIRYKEVFCPIVKERISCGTCFHIHTQTNLCYLEIDYGFTQSRATKSVETFCPECDGRSNIGEERLS